MTKIPLLKDNRQRASEKVPVFARGHRACTGQPGPGAGLSDPRITFTTHCQVGPYEDLISLSVA